MQQNLPHKTRTATALYLFGGSVLFVFLAFVSSVERVASSALDQLPDVQIEITPTSGVVHPTPLGAASSSASVYYLVERVVDGDTLSIRVDGASEKLRLIGINTPETVDPRRPVECFGKEASAKAKSMLEGARVRIESDASQDTRDKYGRLLVYVFLEDGTNWNAYMIREGYAYEYTYKLPYKYQAVFKEAERAARQERRGLWADGACGADNF